jgi:hypothetical protein
MLADFEREATLLSEFDHPNIGIPHSDLHLLYPVSVSGSGLVQWSGSRLRSRKPKFAEKKEKFIKFF